MVAVAYHPRRGAVLLRYRFLPSPASPDPVEIQLIRWMNDELMHRGCHRNEVWLQWHEAASEVLRKHDRNTG